MQKLLLSRNLDHMIKSLTLAALMFVTFNAHAQTGYAIKVNLKAYHNSQVYLGYYYGKLKAVTDSITLDGTGAGTFHGKDRLPGGIYFIVSPKKEILFELLIDHEQHFSIAADSAVIGSSAKFTGSLDNTVFQDYTRFISKDGKALSEAQTSLAASKITDDSAKIISRIKTLDTAIQRYREDVQKKYPSSLLTVLFKAMKEPVIPTQDKSIAAKTDSQFAYHYFKAHYWDDVSFTDERLVRTPLFEPKLDKYFKDLVPPIADSINREVDWMLLYSRTSKEMFKYLLVHFVQKYVNPEYMGQDAVFVHLFEKFINTGQAEFFTDKYRKFVNDRAYSLMANLIGQAAPNLELTDTAGAARPLYGVDAKFVVVCFWDPTCSHCKELVPRLDSIYQAKWKSEGVKIYGVMVDGGKDTWTKYIRDHNLKDWVHVYETQQRRDEVTASNQPGYRQLFDVYQTPTLFLLDKDKHIIAKKLTFQQFDEVIDLKLKNAKTK